MIRLVILYYLSDSLTQVTRVVEFVARKGDKRVLDRTNTDIYQPLLSTLGDPDKALGHKDEGPSYEERDKNGVNELRIAGHLFNTPTQRQPYPLKHASSLPRMPRV